MPTTVIEGRFEVRLISHQSLRQYMGFRGYSIRKLAARVGCSHSTIGFLVKGTRKNTRPEIARRIAEALDCPVEALFAASISQVSREITA
ncbi:helix-turn-helix transcriptional regulator [Propionibacterium freudenreichii]|uniref:helix-turn-helix domain-containing protein n=1 Tax=Propionibacterium freudenreichii TaxID=1744 RepID=UPI0024345CCB|nr:helix-turn-helix transcriptional regulator [Propionibacterium freudenreichii]WFF32431.1 helix-turn-helix transcriptional regulator [Propionibacterium freudenreichii]